jgi:hypothetical protein
MNDFYNNKQAMDGKQSYCKSCAIEKSKRDYKDNNRKTVFVERAKKRRQLCIAVVNLVKKDNGCPCGEKEICCLDFHHPEPNKDKGISCLVKQKSKRKLMEEMKKCAVVCSNCHRKIHAGLMNPPKRCKVDDKKIEEFWEGNKT